MTDVQVIFISERPWTDVCFPRRIIIIDNRLGQRSANATSCRRKHLTDWHFENHIIRYVFSGKTVWTAMSRRYILSVTIIESDTAYKCSANKTSVEYIHTYIYIRIYMCNRIVFHLRAASPVKSTKVVEHCVRRAGQGRWRKIARDLTRTSLRTRRYVKVSPH